MGYGYVIFAPDFVPNSAGTKCLYTLCDLLNQKGYPSFITPSTKTDPTLQAPCISFEEARMRVRFRGHIAVYAETTHGNPLGAYRVARWVLNRPGLLGGEPVYDPREMVFTYSNVYVDYIKNPILGKLYFPTIDQDIFYSDSRASQESGLECFYVGKSSFKPGYFDRDKTFEITRKTPPKTELGKLFRASRVLYCFDNSSIIAYEAALSGCPTVVIPDGSQTKADYEKLELGLNGIAWGLEDLDRARATLPLLPAIYEKTKADLLVQLDLFIDITQRRPTLPLDCPNCSILRTELEYIYSREDALHSSKYQVLRRGLREYFPNLDKFLGGTGRALFVVLGFIFGLFAKRSKKIEV